MLVSIGHVSRYTYDAPVQYSVQSLRLTPPSFDGQRVVQWAIAAPGIETASIFSDCFGNSAHLVSILGFHNELVVIAKGLIETTDTQGVVAGTREPAPVRLYLRQTPKTSPDAGIKELAMMQTGAQGVERMHNLMGAIRAAVSYQTGTTDEHTTASAALAAGQGVCQDHAHIFISAARLLGHPARYVSGYLVGGEDEVPEAAEAHHAWAEVWIDDLGWVGFDPANLICPTDRYVRLANGLDATYAAPISGTRRGGAKEALDVIVEVQQQTSQQQ